MTIFLILSIIVTLKILSPIFISTEIIITYGIEPFDICSKNPELWYYLKNTYIATFITSNFIYSNFIYSKIFFKEKKKSKIMKQKVKNLHSEKQSFDKLDLLIGYDEKTNENIYIPEKGLYQNFLITGTIGAGKTSSAMYPFTQQLMKFNSINRDKKIGMLILDVKGNYYKQVKKYAEKYNLENDLIVIEIGRKPNL